MFNLTPGRMLDNGAEIVAVARAKHTDEVVVLARWRVGTDREEWISWFVNVETGSPYLGRYSPDPAEAWGFFAGRALSEIPTHA